MKKIYAGLFLTALLTLTFELTLIRIFDVLWYPNMAYMVITLAIFSFGLAGVYSTLLPVRTELGASRLITVATVLLGLSALFILPMMNYFPFDYSFLKENPLKIGSLILVYIALSGPFFLAGLIFTSLFTAFSASIQKLYFWDLIGAALGSILLLPLLPEIAPGGILFMVCGVAFFASALFTHSRVWATLAVVIALVMCIFPWVTDRSLEFQPQINKRGLMAAQHAGKIEYTVWDPISKIDIVHWGEGSRRWIAYDGGTQSSYFYRFNGDYDSLRKNIDKQANWQFWGKMVLVSHYLKQDSDQEVLVIGSAGGQETKAALLYGAKHVDGIELVGSVVDMGKGLYGNFTGNLFNDPKVNNQKGEGRSFLRSSDKRYDIIQIMSNHTSSSIASGTGAMATTYLQTVEAYKEFFSHLKDDGMLHINHHIYPRMITTAAKAWKEMGLGDFQKHVVVIDAPGIVNYLPTMLVSMQPWQAEDVTRAGQFVGGQQVVVNPVDQQSSALPAVFFSGDLPDSIKDKAGFRLEASTDNQPYFNFLRKTLSTIKADNDTFVDTTTEGLLNSQMRDGVPLDLVHLFVTGLIAVLFSAVFIFIPWFFSGIRRESSSTRMASLVYFSMLGAGFILLELVFVHIFMKLIGYPLYTYSAVVFAFLLGAGLGSYFSEFFGLHRGTRWRLPFIMIVLYGIVFMLTHQQLFDMALGLSLLGRVSASVAMIVPLAFFLGMPFPLGILQIRENPRGAIAWAWAMNGLFTTIGGMASVLISMFFGFKMAVWVALACYVVALLVYRRLKDPLAAI